MIASFGDIVFEIPLAPESASHSTSASLAAHEIVGGTPLIERTGQESGEIGMSVRLKRHWQEGTVDIENELKKLRALVGADPERLMLGDTDFGRYVLESVDTDYERMTGERVDEASVDLTFTEWN